MCGEQKVSQEVVVKVMKYLVGVSNSNLMSNADHLFSQMEVVLKLLEFLSWLFGHAEKWLN